MAAQNTPLNFGEDYRMLDEFGRISPNLDAPPVSGLMYVAQQVLKRWIAVLGFVWYAVDCGGNMFDLLNGVVTQADLYAKAGELRTQAMVVDGVTDCTVRIELVNKNIIVFGKLDVRGNNVNIRINLNNGTVAVTNG